MLKRFGLVGTKAKAVKVGDVFGRLEVRAIGQVAGTYRYYAVCRCECGSPMKKVKFDALTSGTTVSCGCLRLERTTTHGLTSSPHYKRWRNMIDRCHNSDSGSYPNYGGRGIRVCDAWHDITTFVADLPPGYKPGMEIDRIDNDGHYEPGNVQWSTPVVNSGNRRSVRRLTHNGVTKLMTRWAEDLGISASTLSRRIDVLGWPLKRALTEPARDQKENIRRAQSLRWKGHTKKPVPPKRVLRTVEWQGQRYTVAQLAELTGGNKKLIAKQLFERNWPVERVMAKTNMGKT